ncbi:hypothetical protein SBOR_7269 [Sclerotinia borealis F-4128]|uniref:Uncharacterized protein n=1 Tax=Sclerotinia borealis (strain F-4128) TaxID=1432307 RepID=W9CC01_SCLBF|nr:hypothetical protein SBOR_7269 [Sclerotinia borealis F-4128]
MNQLCLECPEARKIIFRVIVRDYYFLYEYLSPTMLTQLFDKSKGTVTNNGEFETCLVKQKPVEKKPTEKKPDAKKPVERNLVKEQPIQ